VVAEVDGTEITSSDLVKYYRRMVPPDNPKSKKKPIVPEKLKVSILERIIENKLLLKVAAREGITVSGREVERLYTTIAKDYGDNFTTYLKKIGLTPDEWKTMLRNDLLIDKTLKRHLEKIGTVSQDDIAAYYETHQHEFQIPMQYRISQIVVPTMTLARQIHERLTRGEDFSELAKKYSILPEGKEGGDLGYWREDRLPKEFEIVRQMKVGEISNIIHSPYGYHILMLSGLREARTLSLKEAAPRIARELIQQKKAEEKEKWLANLKEKAKIVRHLDVLKDVTF